MIYLLVAVTVLYLAVMFYIRLDESLRDAKATISTVASVVYVLAISAIIVLSCFQRINPGEVGVMVNLFGSHKGVEEQELHVGYHCIKPWATVYRFPIFEQNHQWTGKEGFNFQTSEGLSVHADLGITFNLEPDRIHDLFAKYRRNMEEITHLFIRNNIRDAINRSAAKLKIEELFGPQKEIFFDEIQDQLKTELQPLGFNISHLYIIGQFNVPDGVLTALNSKIEATQRAQQRENELREAEAQARKEIATISGEAQSRIIRAKSEAEANLLKARAEAESNNLVSRSLTSQLIEWKKIDRWNGELPLVNGSNGNIIDLGKFAKNEKQ